MQIGSSKWAGGILLSLLFAPPAAADLFSYTGGVQTFTAPVAGQYQITADGASGGSAHSGGAGGLGAEIGGNFTLTAGEVLSIYVGHAGSGSFGDGGGGGGGSFVIAPDGSPLIVAGGGGGGIDFASGGGGLSSAASSNGGLGGSGGGGGGFTSNGGGSGGGRDLANGLSGGAASGSGGAGGFGAGGGGGDGGGGGGGYSGGNGGFDHGGGGGGGSFDAGIDQILTAGANSGDGTVDIEPVLAAVPEPTSCVLFGTLLVGVCAGLRKRSRLAR